MTGYEKGYYIDTKYDEQSGERITTVYEYYHREGKPQCKVSIPKPLKSFSHEHRAIKYVKQLKEVDAE